jgi:hypothetical protein
MLSNLLGEEGVGGPFQACVAKLKGRFAPRQAAFLSPGCQLSQDWLQTLPGGPR